MGDSDNKRAFLVVSPQAGAGKTLVAAMLVRRLRARGLLAAGMKPVETGCTYNEDSDLVARDGAQLGQVSSWVPPYVVAPYRFASEGPPPIAAQSVGTDLRLSDLAEAVNAAFHYADVLVIEGSGPALTSIAEDGSSLDLAARLDAALIIVSRHDSQPPDALVAQAKASGITVAGRVVVSHRPSPAAEPDDDGSPRVVIPFFDDCEDLAALIDAADAHPACADFAAAILGAP